MNPIHLPRRRLLAGAAGAFAAALLERRGLMQAQTPADPTKLPGHALSELGERSPFERPRRIVGGDYLGASLTPLQDLCGIITPSDLHYERHHAGVPSVDPHRYKLLVHGLVERPLVFDLEALRRFPRVAQFHFLECAGNGSPGFAHTRAALSPQLIDGLTSTSEWTGVAIATLFREVGVKPEAKWFLAEGGDAAVFLRSIPIAKAWDDAMIAYGQNGEALRPEQGYPARLLVPGFEGSSNVKWIRRIELTDRPAMSREETSKYTNPSPDDAARMFNFAMDAKSIITFPAWPRVLEPGWWEVTGIAWSGRGRITRVDVSTDGGRTWAPAGLDEPVLPKCHTRFRKLWNWDGREAVLMSRATDETGYVQPTRAELQRVRGAGARYHFNNIRAWRVPVDGKVVYGLEA